MQKRNALEAACVNRMFAYGENPTAERIAEAIGLELKTYHRIILGVTQPRAKTIDKLCNFLAINRVQFDALFTYEERASFKEKFASKAKTAPTVNENLVSNQAFIQVITNLRQSIKQARYITSENSQLKVENEVLNATFITYLDGLDSSLAHVIDKTDVSADPIPVQDNAEIRTWFVNEWPEVIDKLKEFTNKKALADMIVPSGIVAAFGVCGLVVGLVLDAPPAVSFGAGSFIGMFATRQVSSKELGKEIESILDENDS